MSFSPFLVALTVLAFLRRLVLDFDLLVFAFGQFPLVAVSWICMFLSALVVPFVLLHWWADVYSSSYHGTFYTLVAATLLLLYQSFGLGFLPTYIVLKHSLPPASCFILILEQVLNVVLQLYIDNLSSISNTVPALSSSWRRVPESTLTSCFLPVLNLPLPVYDFILTPNVPLQTFFSSLY